MNILIVEDEAIILYNLIYSLKEYGYDPSGVTNSFDALEIYNKQKFDVVITDLNMPFMNGIELIRQIRQLDKNINIIVMTAHCDTDKSVELLNYHIYGLLKKPFSVPDILGLLKEIKDKNSNEKKVSELNTENIKLRILNNVLMNLMRGTGKYE